MKPTPLALYAASKENVDINDIPTPGTGRGGAITMRDVNEHIASRIDCPQTCCDVKKR